MQDNDRSGKLPRIFMANVGVNASHSGKRLQSPLFEDGRFEFVTIPEPAPFQQLDPETAPTLLRYRDLKCFNDPNQPLTDYLPLRTHTLVTHYDPEFHSFTYGDECNKTPRAAALKQLRVGDWLFFLARLANYDRKTCCFSGEVGFYLVGAFEIETIISGVRAALSDEQAPYNHNAHIRRAIALPEWYDGFYIFKGSPRSQRFTLAQPFGRAEAEQFLRDKNGAEWAWKADRTVLQTIGSYTRTCRCVLDPARSRQEASRTQDFLSKYLNKSLALN